LRGIRLISRLDLFRLYLRSFFVQAGFTYERLLAFGFVWTLIPLARRLFSSAEERRDFLKRHLLGFNANPYLAGYALGAVAKLEEERVPPQQIIRFKELMQSPLGAVGDSLIWQNLRPVLLVLGIVLTTNLGAYGALAVWLIFNCYQIYLRARGIRKGYRMGLDVYSDLGRGHLQVITKWSSRMGAIILGVLFILSLGSSRDLTQLSGLEFNSLSIGLLILFTLLSVFGLKRSLNPGHLLPGFIFFCLFLRLAFGIP
jgi:mannose/fructose/N-acetylgalactosamine-specific phosphotransferase system component IID